MRRLTLLLVSLVLLSIQSVLAQSFSVKGTVVSAEDNEPMIGVTIMQEGTSNGSPDISRGKVFLFYRKFIPLHHEQSRTISISTVDSAIRDTFKF